MDYDIIIIGAGPGGYVCAIRAAQLGKNVAVIEDRDVGGTCLNRGCIPAKALLHSAEIYQQMKESEAFGIIAAEPTVDVKKMFSYKDGVSVKLREGVEQLFKANKIALIRGKAQLLAEHNIKVISDNEEKELTAEDIVLATGSVPARIPIPGADLPGVMTSDELFQYNEKIPESMVIIGGGVISVEFAQVYSSLGTKVTILEALPRILPMMDRDISRNLSTIMKKHGVDVNADASVKEIRQSSKGLTVVYIKKEKEVEVECENVLIAVGRRSNTEGLFAKDDMLNMERGKIVTDASMKTSMDHVYAIGDVTKSIQLAHVASAQGTFVAEKIAGVESHICLDIVPSCVYTSPEIACVGKTEAEAKEEGITFSIGKFITSGNGKSIISAEERGFVKVIFDEKDILIGAQMMCRSATDMIGELATAIANQMTKTDLTRAMRAHPTVNESIGEAIEDSMGCAIHIAPKRKR